MSCQTGKVGYANPTRAYRAAREISRTGRRSLRAYHCEFCGSWHLHSRGLRR